MPTEAARVEAIRQILIQLYSLHKAGLHSRHISRIERECIFFLYEFAEVGKFDNSRPHSRAAKLLKASRPAKLHTHLTYDHAIPFATLRAEMMEAVESSQKMHAFLKRFIKGVVITRVEDRRLSQNLRRKLPPGALSHDMMARYRAAEIAFDADDEKMLCANLLKTDT